MRILFDKGDPYKKPTEKVFYTKFSRLFAKKYTKNLLFIHQICIFNAHFMYEKSAVLPRFRLTLKPLNIFLTV